MSMNNPIDKATDLAKIANEDWPIINELSKKSFLIKSKKSNVNIEEASNSIQKSSAFEDKKLNAQNQKDEGLLQKSEIEVPVSVIKTETVVEEIVGVKPNLASDIDESVEQYPTTLQKKEVISRVAPVVEKNNALLLKQVWIGLMHLFVTKATTLLKPLNFLMQNFSKFFIAMIHVFVPLVMTYWATTKISFVSTQLAKESTTMYWVYFAIFYLACTFIWIVGQVVAAGLGAMFKKAVHDVAKVGQEKI
jgi:hypothetical protein